MRPRMTMSALATAIAMATPAAAQDMPTPPEVRYAMPFTATWDMDAAHGERYRIFVSYPEGDPPEGGYPVLYVLDGNAMFAAFAEARRMLERTPADRLIVVGVGYPTDQAYHVRRIEDFTGAPTTSPAFAKFADERSGGWDRFLDFLTGRLRTEIGERYPVNPARQALYGHSLGGLLAVHALFTRPRAFHAIIAASPSLFWHEAITAREERRFAADMEAGRGAGVARLLVVSGEREEAALERWDAADLAARLAPLSAHGLRVRSRVYEDEIHATVPVRSVTDALRFALAWP